MNFYLQVRKSSANKWYWYLHQECGHIYHISDGFLALSACLEDLIYSSSDYIEKLHADKA